MPDKANIYTKGGDRGETSLLSGTRVLKSHDRVEAYGTLDELNSFVGMLRDSLSDAHLQELLLRIQEALFIAEAWIATDPEKPVDGLPEMDEGIVTMLEQEIDEMTSRMPVLTSFILPGGSSVVSWAHIARTVSRRAERCVIRLHQGFPVEPVIIRFLNRLSDFFFVLARFLAHTHGIGEITWPRKG